MSDGSDPAGSGQDSAAARRLDMVELQIVRRGIRDPEVIAAMRAVPRHIFVPDELVGAAYEDSPLPIGYGQTISQPYMVALMTELLEADVRSCVLEVGAGSGYQTAVLAELAGEVYAVERIPALVAQARERLERLGYRNAHVALGDGTHGWPEHAPYHGVLVAAAAPEAPPPLLAQLAEGGRLVIPLGDAHRDQMLTVYERRGTEFRVEHTLRCRFVPLLEGEVDGDETLGTDVDDGGPGGEGVAADGG